MTRVSDRLLVQWIDGEGVVFVDESSQEEVVVPPDQLGRVIETLLYFQRQATP